MTNFGEGGDQSNSPTKQIGSSVLSPRSNGLDQHKNEVSVYEFIWAFMQVLEHDREEELFITNALIEFYEHIKE